METIIDKLNSDSESSVDEDVSFKTNVLEKEIGDSQQKKEKSEENITSDNRNSVKFLNFLNEIQKIIKEDEIRRIGYENCQKKPSFPIVNYPADMSIEEIEYSLDNLKQNIINKLNKYFDQLREVNTKLMRIENENKTLQETIKHKSGKFQKSHSPNESMDNFKSLNLTTNKKNKIQLDQLNEEIKTLEKDMEDHQSEIRNLKKEKRKLKAQFDEVTDDLTESEEKNTKLESEIKNLKKQIKGFKDNKKSDNEDEVSDLKKEIKRLKSEIKNRGETNDRKKDEQNEIKQLLQEKDENFKILQSEKQDILDEKNSLQKLLDERNENENTLKDTVEKKNAAIQSIKKKYDDEIALKMKFEEENKTLKDQCIKLEAEKAKKHEALSILRDKIANYKTQENEIQTLRLTKQQLNSKEKEVESLIKENDRLNKTLEDKLKDYELLKKEKLSCEEEIKNMKQLKFQSKANTETK